MGSPKPLLSLNGETFVDRLIGTFSDICHPIIVVLGYGAERVRAGMKREPEVEIVVNAAPERGMLSSLQCGLARVPAGAEAVIFTPVDYPCIRKSTVEALGRADGAVVIAGFEGKRGHPVRVSRAVAAELLSLPDDAQARDVIRLHAAGTLLLETGDPGILNDIDTPQAYNELVSAWGAQR